ncbi:MAG: DEAD/DEAH box helicase [bacterium]
MSVFHRLHPRLREAIVHRLGWTHLRPVQEHAGEAILAGDNAVVLAPTAGGKTEAALFPALSTLLHAPPQGVGVLYIAPIKALLNNQADRLGHYTEMVGLDRFVWHGDVPTSARRAFIRDPAALLMTTPESLEVMQISPRVDAGRLFGDLRLVVVDEIHALAGTDRGAHLASVIERLAAITRHDLQRVGLSATVGNPDAILEWLRGASRRPGRVVDPPAAPRPRHLLVLHRDAAALAQDAAAMARGRKSLVFCQSRRMTEAIAERMKARGVPVFVHHSSISAEERARAEAAFQGTAHGSHDGDGACIVCTSTLELGIDVGDLDRVFQAEAPTSVGAFLQRMGRTGRRADQPANTTFFCETHEGVWLATALVELARRGWVESVPRLDRCWPVLVHQLFALSSPTMASAPKTPGSSSPPSPTSPASTAPSSTASSAGCSPTARSASPAAASSSATAPSAASAGATSWTSTRSSRAPRATVSCTASAPSATSTRTSPIASASGAASSLAAGPGPSMASTTATAPSPCSPRPVASARAGAAISRSSSASRSAARSSRCSPAATRPATCTPPRSMP